MPERPIDLADVVRHIKARQRRGRHFSIVVVAEGAKYNAEALQVFKNVHKLPHKFVLFVGSIEPRKNLKNSLLAYNSLPDSFKKEYKFVLAGFKGWNNLEVMKIINEKQKNIVYLGYLSDHELAYVYNLATVFLYPSLYEGFGLPVLEAMASGTPVITSNTSSLPEVAGDAAVLIDPPYEEAHEFARLSDALGEAHRKWPTGIYVIWDERLDPPMNPASPPP